MSEQELLVGCCNQCGEELRVPAHLQQFSCMFCGAKLTPADLVSELKSLEPDGDYEALLDSVKERVISCISEHPNMHLRLNRKEFEPAFEGYAKDCSGIFRDLDTVCRMNPTGRSAHIEAVVTSFLDQLEQLWMQHKDWSVKHKQRFIQDDDKMTIAIFLVPMVDSLKLSIGDEFCETLQKQWVERHPKSPFYVGSYESIASGFKKRFKFCFITTAVCEELGKPDDCAELTAFRQFRDGYLMTCADGPALVEEYYNIAPGIVSCINLCSDRTASYAALRDQYLDPCYTDLQAGRMEQCKTRYTQMVRDLQAQYLS